MVTGQKLLTRTEPHRFLGLKVSLKVYQALMRIATREALRTNSFVSLSDAVRKAITEYVQKQEPDV